MTGKMGHACQRNIADAEGVAQRFKLTGAGIAAQLIHIFCAQETTVLGFKSTRKRHRSFQQQFRILRCADQCCMTGYLAAF